MTGITLQQLYNNILSESQNMTTLSGLTTVNSYQQLLSQLNSTSQVDPASLFYYVIANSEYNLQQNLINFYNELETLKNRSGYGSYLWLQNLALQFQLGDIAIIDPTTYVVGYTTIDTSKQIIQYASALETQNGVILKVRRLSTDVLSTEELAEFTSYINQAKIIGQRISVLNQPADLLNLQGTIVYNSQLNKSDVQTNVEAAINSYIASLPFASTFVIAELISAVLSVNGVYDFQISTIQGKTYNGAYSNITYTYVSTSGWMETDPTYSLSQYILYQTQ